MRFRNYKLAKEIVRQEYGDARNFITPFVLGYGVLRNKRGFLLVYELARGTGFLSWSQVFGLSIVRQYPSGKTKRMSISQPFPSIAEAELLIKRLSR